MKMQVLLLCITLLLLIARNNASPKRPHIIFMYIDDLGWNDISFHGSLQMPTPNIDSLAKTGIILNNYYVQPMCTPSRGALMTGKYPIRLGLQHLVILPEEPWGLPPEEVILPQYFKQLGYATHGVGKWHLGYFRNDYLPTRRGFDSFFGYWNGREDYFTHFIESNGHTGLDLHDNTRNAWNYMGIYSTDLFTEKGKNIIREHDSSKPLFLYVSHQAVHIGNDDWPLQAPEHYINQFSHIKDEKRRVLAAMTSALDKSVGEIFSALEEKHMLEDSIIVFSADNGGAVEGLEGKNSTSSNWPLRGSKVTVWEGGIRGAAYIWSPLVNRSYVSQNLMHITDWLPTLYAAAGGNPDDLGKIDGFNLWPSLTQNTKSPRDHILHNIDPVLKMEAIRKGQFKIIGGSVFDGKFDGWFDKEGKKQENSPFEETELEIQQKVYNKKLEESEIFQILMAKYKHDSCSDLEDTNKDPKYCKSENVELDNSKSFFRNIMEKTALNYAGAAVKVECGVKSINVLSNCQPMKEYCLFDIENDPCEYNNLANSLPLVVEDLKGLLDEYRMQAVAVENKPADPASYPEYHGYAWVPWIKEAWNSK